MSRSVLALCALLLAGCIENVPTVTCEWVLPDPTTELVSASQGFQARIKVTGSFEEAELAAVWFHDGASEEPLLETAIGYEDGGCSGGCLAGDRLPALTPGQHTIRAEALTPQGTPACSIERPMTVNTPPTASGIVFAPATPNTLDTVTVTADLSDADGDDVATSILWTGPEGNTLDGQLTPINTSVGQTWSVSVTPRDALDPGEPITAEVTIVNTPPAQPEVSIGPVPARTGAPIVCAVTNLDGLDVDASQTLTVAWSWTVDGADAGVSEALVPGGSASGGEVWECTAIVSDGTDVSPAGTATSTAVDDLTIPGAPIELSTLDRVDGYRNAQNLGDARSVSAPGDMDGDGFADFLAFANDGTLFGSGEAELYYFSSTRALPADTTSPDAVFIAPDGFIFRAPSGVGDINGDGLDDALVGYQQFIGGSARGAWILFGDVEGYEGTINLNADPTVDDEDPRITHIDGVSDNIATTPCPVGDLDGDGFAELAITSPEDNDDRGRVYIVWGHPGAWVDHQSPALLLPSFQLTGQSTGLQLGAACAGPVDLDGNGLNDLVLAAPGGGGGNGRVYVFFMDGNRPSSSVTTSGADVLIDAGAGTPGGFGSSMVALGDYDGDSFDDIAISGLGGPSAGAQEGAVWIASGAELGMTTAITSADLAQRIDGFGTVGFCSRPAGGDVNGDGLGDLSCGDGSPANALLEGEDPAVRIFLGRYDGLPATLSYSDADLTLSPENPGTLDVDGDVDDTGDEAGTVLAVVPDWDGDGYNELIVGAPGTDPGIANDGGTLYLLNLTD
jgi:hypothetical protein